MRYTDPTGHMQESDDDYCYGCTLPPPVCSSSMCNPNIPTGGGNGGGGGTPTVTPTPCTGPYLICVPTATSTPSATPTATSTATPPVGMCGGNMYCLASSTPTYVPPPIVPTLQAAAPNVIPILNPFNPSFEPDIATGFWNAIGNGLPVLIGLPATSIEQVVTKIINVGIRVAETGTNVITNIGLTVDEAVYTGVGGLSAPPIFYIPPDNPFLPSNGSN